MKSRNKGLRERKCPNTKTLYEQFPLIIIDCRYAYKLMSLE